MAFCRPFRPWHHTGHRHAAIAMPVPMMSTALEPAVSRSNANEPSAASGAGVRSDFAPATPKPRPLSEEVRARRPPRSGTTV